MKIKKYVFIFVVFVLLIVTGLRFGFGQAQAQTDPSSSPSSIPTAIPTAIPTDVPTVLPTQVPTEVPTVVPTVPPTTTPTVVPTVACPTLPTNNGIITKTITIASTSQYTAWSRLLAPNTNNASYYLQIDDQCGIKVGGFSLTPNIWTWVNYSDGNTNNKITLQLTQGTHIVKMIGNTPGLGLDKVIFTADMTCLPSGWGNNCNQIITPTIAPTTVVPTSTQSGTPAPTTSSLTPTTTLPITTAQIPTDTPAPTATPIPGTEFAVTVLMHGIGHGGDNVAPNSEGNKAPIHIQRTAAVEIYDSNNVLVASPTGKVTFDPFTGTYKGIISVGRALPAGAYITKIIIAHHLNKTAVKIVTITNGEANPIPLDAASLVAGDLNGDGRLNIEDFNLIMGCVSDLGPAKQCDPTVKDAADVNDDGVVDLADLNLYFREIAVQTGQ